MRQRVELIVLSLWVLAIVVLVLLYPQAETARVCAAAAACGIILYLLIGAARPRD